MILLPIGWIDLQIKQFAQHCCIALSIPLSSSLPGTEHGHMEQLVNDILAQLLNDLPLFRREVFQLPPRTPEFSRPQLFGELL